MRGVVAWFVKNSVAANLMMLVIIAFGLLSIGTLVVEIFPDISVEAVTVTVPYLGAAPEEVEDGVCVRVEEAVQDLEGVKEINSTAAEGVGTVMIEFEAGTDLRKALDEVKSRVDSIETFPEETEKPIVQEVLVRAQVINVAVAGAADEATLKALGERVRDDLSALDGITQVELVSARPYEISIEVSEQALRQYGLTFDEVVRAVQRSSLDLPGGSVRTDSGEILLRTKGQAYRGPDFERIVLRARPDGTRLVLSQVANVVDGFAETDESSRFDSLPSVMVQVYRVGDQSALEIAETVRGYVAQLSGQLPDGVELVTWQDDSKILEDRLDLLLRNGRVGLVLVFLVLALFLKLRLAGWVSAGIAVSFTGAIALLPHLDVSINVISLFAFILVLGIVVDDAIVVGENIYRHHEMGKNGLQAAVAGAQEVAVPVTFSVLTTIAAFAPLLMVEGGMGRIMRVIPIVVILSLSFSLIESLWILPSHLSHLGRNEAPGPAVTRGWRRLREGMAGSLQWVVERAYRPALERVLEWRYLTVAAALVLLALTTGLVVSGWIRYDFFPAVEAENAIARLTMPQGTPVEVTTAAMAQIEEAAHELERQLQAEGHEGAFRHLLTTVGSHPFISRQAQATGSVKLGAAAMPHLGEVNIELAPSEERTVGSAEIAERWRQLTGPIPDAVELVFQSELMSLGEPVNIQLASANLADLRAAAAAIRESLLAYPGVFDVTDSFRPGKQEIKLDVTEGAEALGVSRADLARQVRQAFYGAEAQRIQRGRDDVRVMVRYPAADRETLASLESMRIRTPQGDEVPFSFAGRAELGRGFATIHRTDRQRTVNVTADVSTDITPTRQLLEDLQRNVLPQILAAYPSVSYELAGEQQQQRETFDGLGRGFVLALILIYGLLAIPFRSYVQPLLVMSAIPFGLVGAVYGHVVLGMELTVLSGFGVVALTGVVVNDSLVLVDFINRRRRAGFDLETAIREAGAARFRPILLTSLTTFAGLTPLLLERSLQSQFLKPMAASLAFGVLFATAITLLLVPVLYRILEDLQGVGRERVRTPVLRPRAVTEGRDERREETTEVEEVTAAF